MKISKAGLKLLKKYEGCKLRAYLCPADKWTIGWGATFYPAGGKVKEGDIITQEQADKMLLILIEQFEAIVNNHIKIKLSQNQFDALVVHTYNSGGSETLFRLVNAGQPCRDFWVQHYITANGVISKGLIKRRWEEYNLFINVA